VTGKTKSRRSPRWAKLSLALGLVLMVAGGVGVVGTRVFGAVAFHSVHQENLLGAAGEQAEQTGQGNHVAITGAKTILLVGIDSRPDQKESDLVRSDSIILAHIPPSHDAMYLVSIPRDTSVAIPAFNNGAKRFPGGREKINAAYAHGGDGLTGKAARAKAVELLRRPSRRRTGSPSTPRPSSTSTASGTRWRPSTGSG
jgi:anionic cell wall polymer biosynthesis LytR-Cps2A-Psr (LCP) family protein